MQLHIHIACCMRQVKAHSDPVIMTHASDLRDVEILTRVIIYSPNHDQGNLFAFDP